MSSERPCFPDRSVRDAVTALRGALRSVEQGSASPLRECWRAASQLRSASKHADMPGLTSLARHLASGMAHHAGKFTSLRPDEADALGSWCDTLVNVIEDGKYTNEINRLLDALSLVTWLPQLDESLREPMARALYNELGQPSSSTLQLADEELPRVEITAARDFLAAAGVELDGFGDDDILALSAALQSRPETSNDSAPLSPVVEQQASGCVASDHEAGLHDSHALQVTDDTEATAAETLSDIWIAPEELELTQTAVGQQFLPLAMALTSSSDRSEQEQAREDLAFNCELVGNAMEMLGTRALCDLLHAISERARRAETETDAESLMQIGAALLAYLHEPGPESGSMLGAIACELNMQTSAWQESLLLEARRIRIGRDPSLIAARKRTVEPQDLDLSPASDVLPNVLASMLRELPTNASRLGEAVRSLVASRDFSHIDEARRVAHTLKGDANTVGIRGLANLTHTLEDTLIELIKSPDRLDTPTAQFLLEAVDVVEECADFLLGRGPAPDALALIYQQALDCSNALLESALPSAGPVQDLQHSSTSAQDDPALEAARAPESSMPGPALEASERTLAVETSLLDELQRLAGELLVLSRQVEQRLSVLGKSERDLRAEVLNEQGLADQLEDLVALRGAALKSASLAVTEQVDALELDQYSELHIVSRRLSESHADKVELVRQLERTLSDIEPLTVQQQRLNEQLQRIIDRTTTVSFDEISPRLQRVVRQTARQLDRAVSLQISGESIGLDADILEGLVEPLAHLLRNAVDHAIESSEERLAQGKPEEGAIRIGVSVMGDSAIVEVADDGRGLDLNAIRTKAVAQGIIDPSAELDDDTTARLILVPGFSTRETVSHVSGRGVGMDVVNQRVRELRGTLSLSSVRGSGTRFLIQLPMSRTQADVVVVFGHGVSMAATMIGVRSIVALTAEQMSLDAAGRLHMEVDGTLYPARTIESLFSRDGAQSLPGETPCLGLLVEASDGMPQLLCVSEVSEVLRAVVKPISPLLPTISAVRGVTQLGDGRLAPVVDLASMLERRTHATDWTMASASSALPALPRVVVADDSLSVRRALEQLMQDAGYDVAAARDGMEAIQRIAERTPVAVLLDLEMPRMNGLEVCRYLRAQAATRDVPVIMITSRASEKYRVMAEESGVTHLLGKPFSEDALVSLVRTLVADISARHNEELFQ